MRAENFEKKFCGSQCAIRGRSALYPRHPFVGASCKIVCFRVLKICGFSDFFLIFTEQIALIRCYISR